MLPFAHIGITLAMFYIVALVFPKVRVHISYWHVAVGSMLPDIIDKVIGRMLFEDVFANGRIFAHSLLFVVVLIIAGHYIYSRKGSALVLVLGGGSFVHLMLDSMWKAPVTLLWPLLGWEFERGTQYGSFLNYIMGIYGNLGNVDGLSFMPALMTEVLGITVIIFFGLGYMRQRINGGSSGEAL